MADWFFIFKYQIGHGSSQLYKKSTMVGLVFIRHTRENRYPVFCG